MRLPSFKVDLFASCAAAGKLAIMLTAMALLTPVHLCFRAARPNDVYYVPLRFHRLLCRLMGLRLRVTGQPAGPPPVLFVANHASYLDIPALGAILPASFIAKSEVATWPIIGFLARMQNTIFVERRPARAAAQRDLVQRKLAGGTNLVLFPEGTSSDGLRALPFKSTLFGIAQAAMGYGAAGGGAGILVQPVSITCSALDGLPMTRALRPLYAWYGDMTLAGHLWNALKAGHFTIDIVFHDAVAASAFGDRKALAQYCQTQVARGIERSVTQRADAATAHLSPPPEIPA